MKAIVMPSPNELAVAEVPEPGLGDYQALARILTGTICNGTDSKVRAGEFPPNTRFPKILGHETIGRIVQVGAKVRNYRVGDLVLRAVAVPPGEMLGPYSSAFGGFVEYGVVNDGQAFCDDHLPAEHAKIHRWWVSQQVVPPDFDPRFAGTFITFKETLSFAWDLGIGPGKSVLVLGSGPVGFSFAKSAQILGAGPVIVLGRRARRLAMAEKYGADAVIDTSIEDPPEAMRRLTDNHGADFVIEAIGSTELLAQSVRLVARGGTIGVYGVAADQRVTIDYSRTNSPGQFNLRFLAPREHVVHDWALHLIRTGAVDLGQFITHELPISEIERGFGLLGESSTLKVVLQIDGQW